MVRILLEYPIGETRMPDPVVPLLMPFVAADWTTTSTGPLGPVVMQHRSGPVLKACPRPADGLWRMSCDGRDIGDIPRLNRDVMDDLQRALAPHGQLLVEAWRAYMLRVMMVMRLPPGPWRWDPQTQSVTPNPTQHVVVPIPPDVAQHAVAELAPYVVYERPSIIEPRRLRPAHLGLEIHIPRTPKARKRLLNTPQFA